MGWPISLVTRSAVIGVLATAAPALAKSKVEARYSPDYNTCMASGDAANGVTSGLMDCSSAEIDRQDTRLNEAYKVVMMRFNPSQKSVLRASERAWIGERNARCFRASASEQGGSLAGVIYSNCVLDETIKRLIWLETYKG